MVSKRGETFHAACWSHLQVEKCRCPPNHRYCTLLVEALNMNLLYCIRLVYQPRSTEILCKESFGKKKNEKEKFSCMYVYIDKVFPNVMNLTSCTQSRACICFELALRHNFQFLIV